MAKSILIKNPNGQIDIYTEGVNDCAKIVVKYSFSNVVDVAIYFNSNPKREYYQCPCIVGQNMTWNPPTPTYELYTSKKTMSAEVVLNKSYVDLIPSPAPTFYNFLISMVAIVNPGTIPFSGAVSQGVYLKCNGNIASSYILSYGALQSPTPIAGQLTAFTASSALPVMVNVNSPLSIHNNANVTAGNGTVDIYSTWIELPIS